MSKIIVTDDVVGLHNSSERDSGLAFRVRLEEGIQISKKTNLLSLVGPFSSPSGNSLWEREEAKVFVNATRKRKHADESPPLKGLLQRTENQWPRYNLLALKE